MAGVQDRGGKKSMKSRMKKVMKKVICVLTVIAMFAAFVPNVSYAATPNIDTKFKVLRTGTNYIKTYNYKVFEEALAGRFVAPETGKYTITVINNGANTFGTRLYDKNLSEIESTYNTVYCGNTVKYTYVLKKNQKIYVHIEQGWSAQNELIAARIIITKQSTAPRMSRDSAIIKRGGTTTLKVIGAKKKAIWASGNRKIATVTYGGVVKGKGRGTTYVYAIVNNRLYRCRVTVR